MRPDLDPFAELQAQVRNLERRMAALENREIGASAQVPDAHPSPPKSPEPKRERFESRLGATFINRAGAITLAVGILFFFKYAVDDRWIGAAGRVALGIAAGLLLVGVAEWLRKRGQQAFAQGVTGCGIAVLYTALYASFAYYRLFPQWLAFCGMFAACALSFVLSFRYGSAALAVLGTAGAILAPVLLGHAFGHPWLLFLYLLLVDIGVLASALRRRWTIVYALAFAGTVILFVAWTSASNAAESIGGLLFLCAFFALFFVVSIRSAAREFPAPMNAFFPLNAAWTVFSAWMLLDRDHPGWLAVFALGLAAVHFIAAVPGTRAPAVRNWLYALGHACLLTAALRELEICVAGNSAPVNRASMIGESTSVFLALYAIAAIAWGVVRRSSLDRAIGLVLLVGVVGKLYCYDVWQLTRFYRISAFVALGILLLAASYIYSRFREKLEALWAAKGTETERPA
ncbi:MAG: DUF2339 domain-containing protein [Bryobacteraceae bacterium]